MLVGVGVNVGGRGVQLGRGVIVRVGVIVEVSTVVGNKGVLEDCFWD